MINSLATTNITNASQEYQNNQLEYLQFYSKIAGYICIFLILIGSGLDWSFYPNLAVDFFIYRLIFSVAIFCIIIAISHKTLSQFSKYLTLIWVFIPQILISYLISQSDCEKSIYFVGLIFALSCVSIITPITLLEAISFSILTLVAYATACGAFTHGLNYPNQFYGNTLFLALFGVVCVSMAFFGEKWRWQSFALKNELIQKNLILTKINYELVQIKGHMIQQEKMSALGTLSAGLLHEVNNPVNYSLMALNLALEEPEMQTNKQLKESLIDSQQGMQRVQMIVSDLKTFAYQKPNDNTSRLFLFEKALTAAIRLSSAETKGIDIRMELPLDTHVRGDEPGVIGVLINLITNAALALRKSGQAKPYIQIRGWHGEPHRLFVTVRDNGTGIKPEHMTKIFEPFFTTRDVGQGLGLGLAVSYAVIKRHNSELKVSSELGAWTQFDFDLPTSESTDELGEMIKTFEFNPVLPDPSQAKRQTFEPTLDKPVKFWP